MLKYEYEYHTGTRARTVALESKSQFTQVVLPSGTLSSFILFERLRLPRDVSHPNSLPNSSVQTLFLESNTRGQLC